MKNYISMDKATFHELLNNYNDLCKTSGTWLARFDRPNEDIIYNDIDPSSVEQVKIVRKRARTEYLHMLIAGANRNGGSNQRYVNRLVDCIRNEECTGCCYEILTQLSRDNSLHYLGEQPKTL